VKRTAFVLLLSVLLGGNMCRQAQKNTSKSTISTQKKSKSFIDRVLDFLAISYTPGAQKGPAPDISNGQIWVADMESGSTRALTVNGSFRSPVFFAESADILALRGNDVVRIPSAGGEGIPLQSVPGILKLVGVGSQNSGKILVLLRNETGSHPRVALLAIDTGSITNLPYDPESSQDLQLVEHLEGWSRSYGESSVYVKRQTKETLAGTVQWSDVFLAAHSRQPVNVSRCDGRNCGQPSLSQDGNRVVYVKDNPND
jgi:hypothetical protein